MQRFQLRGNVKFRFLVIFSGDAYFDGDFLFVGTTLDFA